MQTEDSKFAEMHIDKKNILLKMQDFLSKSAKKSRIRDLQAVASEV
ncbi:hypothetical protein HGO97_013090 [Faecalicatena sp. AGMB00832]|uniref:Uncharacterized protein n=1 Tax=Faecalicatena faecalis TaxID=2726362 RepID=A0ABS6D565_9FIRM|nr:hypothetical protein [Faecalicatena faecalis]MBU3876742.1 hypothetical protein [Faecalicatena faecalis]